MEVWEKIVQQAVCSLLGCRNGEPKNDLGGGEGKRKNGVKKRWDVAGRGLAWYFNVNSVEYIFLNCLSRGSRVLE
jgi:hypothetical protein